MAEGAAKPALWGDEFQDRIEHSLAAATQAATASNCPPRLGDALRYAVFPGGCRIRPALCLAVAKACGDTNLKLAEGVAAAIELLHCASLVHDDLACFDDAGMRRGKPALHRVFGEALAVLAGDGLTILAFQTLAEAGKNEPGCLSNLLFRLSKYVGSSDGLVAGQAWELEPMLDLRVYHACKTAAMFEAATVCGALVAGSEGDPWSALGRKLGQAYQAADDVADVTANPTLLGKPTGQDLALGRPSVALQLGVLEAPLLVSRLLDEAMQCIPSCCGAGAFREWFRTVAIPMVQRKTIYRVPTAAG